MTLLTAKQLAQRTNESIFTWRKRMSQRLIPVVKLGTNVRVREEDLEKWILERRLEAEDD